MGLISHRLDSETVIDSIGDPVAGLMIVGREVFNLPYLYFLFHEWLIENGYASRADFKFGEKYFMQRESTAGSEIRVRWRCQKKSKDDLFIYKLDINWWLVAVKETEIVVKGKKLKANTGECEIKLWPRMILNPDYNKGEWLPKFINGIFLNRIIKHKREEMRKQLYNDAFRLQEALKTYLKIETYLEEPELKRFFTLRTGE